jgi:4-carboxymuconolactone decarboxylase
MTSRPPRIAPLKREDVAPQVEAMYKRMDAMGNPPPNMHLTFGKNPGLYEKWLPFATYIIPASSLAQRDRQILILRSAYRWRCGYVWAQHVEISRRLAALSGDEMAALCREEADGSWSRHERALVAAVDETTTAGEISDPVWSALADRYSEDQLLDLVFTIGQYSLISTALRSLRVQLDAGLSLPGWAVA